MNAEDKFQIISEGQKWGVSETCRSYGISRTLYYRWLNRYKSLGMKGLDDIQKTFVPVNKTPSEIVASCLSLIKHHPLLGPREIKYKLEAIGHPISESAVYSIMKCHQLSTRSNRLKFARKKDKKTTNEYPSFDVLRSGECWLFWSTHYGDFKGIGSLYEYTILDYKSKIACTRLYNALTLENFINLLTAVAIPVGQTLSFETKHLCIFDDYSIKEVRKDNILSVIHNAVQNSGIEITIHLLKSGADFKNIHSIREAYTHQCLSYLMPYIHQDLSFNEIKLQIQNHIREYNINYPLNYEDYVGSPIAYHLQSTNINLILPLWAYFNREY